MSGCTACVLATPCCRCFSWCDRTFRASLKTGKSHAKKLQGLLRRLDKLTGWKTFRAFNRYVTQNENEVASEADGL